MNLKRGKIIEFISISIALSYRPPQRELITTNFVHYNPWNIPMFFDLLTRKGMSNGIDTIKQAIFRAASFWDVLDIYY